MNTQALWNLALQKLHLQISSANFKTWFSRAQLSREEGEKPSFSIVFPSPYLREKAEERYFDLTRKTLQEILGSAVILKFTYHLGMPSVEKKTETGPLFSFGAEEEKKRQNQGLNSHYTFQNFVVGNSNNLAHAIAQAVTQQPGTLYNPFFLYSGVGLGKTHLIQAIGNALGVAFPRLKIIYSSAEEFTNALIESLQNRTQKAFREKYRRVDVLLMDDVQFLAGRESTQEEFFHTFNALYLARKQIVLTSDKPPETISPLPARLISRFAGGMIADLQPPDLELRLAILRSKRESLGLKLDDRMLERIARAIPDNIRELEGALLQVNTLIAHNALSETGIQNILTRNRSATGNILLAPSHVLETVASFFGLRGSELKGNRRLKEIVYPRQIAMYLLREELGLSLPEIGRLLGGRDHTTILHGSRKIEQLSQKRENVRQQLNSLRQLLLP